MLPYVIFGYSINGMLVILLVVLLIIILVVLLVILLVVIGSYFICGVTTLILGSRPRQRLASLRAKMEARKSHLMLLGV